METSIVSVTHSDGLEKKLHMANAHIAASLSIGSDWNQLFIAARIGFTDSGLTMSAARFFFGMITTPAAGLSDGYFSASSAHCLGIVNDDSFSRSTSPLRYATGWRTVKRLGATNTFGNTVITGRYTADTDNVRNVILVSITKGSPNFTLQFSYIPGTAGPGIDIPYSTLVAGLDQTTHSSCIGAINTLLGPSYYYSSSAYTIAVDEGTDGALTHLHVGWNQNAAGARLSEIIFVKKS